MKSEKKSKTEKIKSPKQRAIIHDIPIESEDTSKQQKMIIEDRKRLLEEAEEIVNIIRSDKFVVTNDEIFKKMNKLKLELVRMSNIDLKLMGNLMNLIKSTGKGDIYTVEEYEQIENDLKDSDTILYFKNSELLGKVNNKSDNIIKMCTKIGLNSEVYNGGKNIYEVVRDKQPQKITIISSCELAEKHELIREYICEYMEEYKCKIESKHIKCFKNDDDKKFEILITKYFVPDAKEKDEFITGLRKFIKRKKGDKTVLKYLGREDPEDFDFQDSASLMMPYHKKDMNGSDVECANNKGIEELIVSAVKNCKQLKMGAKGPIIININGPVNNIVNSNISKSNIGNVTNEISVYDKLLLDLKTMKPKWYVSDKYLNKHEIFKRFSTLMNDICTELVFWKHMREKLISSERRVQKNGKKNREIMLKKLW